METKDLCFCCVRRTPTWDLKTPYTRPGLGVPEVYSDMLVSCFDIHLTLDTDDECGICEECVGRLRDASDFKLQVQRSQAELRERLERALEIKDEKPEVLFEMFDDDGTNIEAMLRENQLTCDEDIGVRSELSGEEGEESNYEINEVESAAGPRPAAGGAAREGDSAALGTCGSGALSRAVSARARQQLAMTCSVRLERLHQGRICHSAADQESTLTTHMEEMHTDSAAVRAEEEACTCDTCGERFTDKMELVDHVQKHIEASHSCQICSKSFSSKCLLAEHSRSHEAPKASSQILTSVYNLNKQSVTQAERKPYSCNICKKSFKLKRHLTTHIRIHTGQKPYNKLSGEQPYKCDVCNKRFSYNSDLTNHLRIHTGQKPYQCEICNKRFTQSSHLTRHIRIHTGQKPYKCDVCKKRFSYSSVLTKHIRIHTGQKPYQCERCNKRFTQHSNLLAHIKQHSGEQPFKCDVCNKQFSFNSGLTNHLRIHTGQKPYKCEICNKRFAQHYNLTVHIRKHSGEKPYKCDVCDKRFSYNSVLTNHLRIHTGQKPYQCKICNKRFTQKQNMNSHMRRHTGQKSRKKDTIMKN